MQLDNLHPRLELPPRTREQLEAYRRRVRTVKLAEGILAALLGLLISYLLVFALDRLGETPSWVRAVILLAGAVGLGIAFPLKCHRWVWQTRTLEQVARLLRHQFPRLGDQLLGIVELVQSELEQERSESLCRAALHQVDNEVRRRNFRQAVPRPYHRRWAWAVAGPLAVSLLVLVLLPAAGRNSLVRWLWPWGSTPRYTFAQLEKLPDTLVVPYAEPFSLRATLARTTAWVPTHGSVRYGKQSPVQAELQANQYQFDLPPQQESAALCVSVGDARERVTVYPTPRPELLSIQALIEPPDYLQYSQPLTRDVRGGTVSVLAGSRIAFRATTTRPLATAAVNGKPQQVSGNQVTTTPMSIAESTTLQLTWEDPWRLPAKQPFPLSIVAAEDQPPSISCHDMASGQVVLENEVLSLNVQAADDFGVKLVGMEWSGVPDPLRNPKPDHGEKIVSVGSPEQLRLEADATFCASRDGVRAQTVQLRLYTIDYLPDRQREYSATWLLHVMTPEAHAIWMTNQLQRWFRQAQAVYEREQQLHDTNRQLRALSATEVDLPENRHRIEQQAVAERANAQRLEILTDSGTSLIQQAVKNEQFNVETLETWADMLRCLEQIATQRMPSVADLLRQAAEASPSASTDEADDGATANREVNLPPRVGVNRDAGAAPSAGEDAPPRVPSIVDVESSLRSPDDNPPPSAPEASATAGRFTLPGTQVVGGGQPGDSAACPATQKMQAAVREQEDLLDEFAKVAKELQKILDNLEGSTFVKRLKAASRRQLQLASDLIDDLEVTFGASVQQLNDQFQQDANSFAQREVAQSENVYVIQEDLEAYFHRVRQGKFQTVVNEMRNQRIVYHLRGIADDIRNNLRGQSIAQAEFWADSLDRWAEQLVGPG